MLERYSEKARAAITDAQRQAVAADSAQIEPQHLLLALLEVDPRLARRILRNDAAVEAIRKQFPPAGAASALRDVPFSAEMKRVVSYAAAEAEDLLHWSIGTGHLWLGLLREQNCAAAMTLRELGVQLHDAREQVAERFETPKDAVSKEDLHHMLDGLPEDQWETAAYFLRALRAESEPGGSGRSQSAALRRSIFFARYEASQSGSPVIESEHLLLGLLREDKWLARRIVGSHAMVEQIRRDIGARTAHRDKLPLSVVDVPLSEQSQRIMKWSAEESERLHHRNVGPAHLLLGLLREEKCVAGEVLHAHGVTIERVRKEIDPYSASS